MIYRRCVKRKGRGEKKYHNKGKDSKIAKNPNEHLDTNKCTYVQPGLQGHTTNWVLRCANFITSVTHTLRLTAMAVMEGASPNLHSGRCLTMTLQNPDRKWDFSL